MARLLSLAEVRHVSWLRLSNHEPQKILVAVAWPYANGPRHIGHVAGFGVPADIFAATSACRATTC